jgi:hypothetical protein
MAVLQSDGVNHTSDLILRRNGTEGLRLTSSTVQLSSINDGPLAGIRNRIINGNMLIAQRGTSFAAIANGAYSLDRWRWGQAGAMVCTVSQSSDVPNDTFQSSYKADVTTVDTSIAAGDFAEIYHPIEGYNVRDLIGTTFTLSFWVKSPKTGVHCVSFRNSGTPDRSHVKEYTIATANTWEYKTLTISGGLITAGTWNWTNGLGLLVSFTLAAGTTFQTTADAWQTGNFNATANQVNVMDNTANDFFLTGVQLEVGTVATPFERRSIGAEVDMCQRYFEVGFWTCSGMTHVGNGDTRASFQTFLIQKRIVPTVALNTTSISIFAVGSNGAGVNFSGSADALAIHGNGFSMSLMGNFVNISTAVGGGDYAWALRNGQIYFASAEL